MIKDRCNTFYVLHLITMYTYWILKTKLKISVKYKEFNYYVLTM